MLTDEQIENLLYQYTKRQDEFNMAVIKKIAGRLSKIADFDNLYSLESSKIISKDLDDIKSEYKGYIKDQKKRLKDDLWWLAYFMYAEALVYYEHQIELEYNKELVALIEQAIKLAQAEFENLIKNPVFVLRDLQNPSNLKTYNLEQTYRTILNEAFNYRNLSDELQKTALKRTEKQLFDSGIQYLRDDKSKNTKSVTHANPAVRFNVLDSMKKLITKMQNVMGKQFGADGVELSAHIYPAPDHAPAQGHRYTMENVEKMQNGEDFEDVDGNEYIGFVRQIGEWNCRHYFMKVKLNSEPRYTQKYLDKILEDNEKGYTDSNGKHYTLYECTQIQRRYERRIREAKEKYLLAKSLGDKNSMSALRTRVGSLTLQYKQFSRACDISIKPERIKVKDY